jgi:hypothetical protein
MAKAPKPELDEATRRIAERMLSTPPKRHDEMKVGRAKPTPKKKGASRRQKISAKKP